MTSEFRRFNFLFLLLTYRNASYPKYGAVYDHQDNRNPFIDLPEWAECLFAGDCGN